MSEKAQSLWLCLLFRACPAGSPVARKQLKKVQVRPAARHEKYDGAVSGGGQAGKLSGDLKERVSVLGGNDVSFRGAF